MLTRILRPFHSFQPTFPNRLFGLPCGDFYRNGPNVLLCCILGDEVLFVCFYLSF